MTLNEIEAFAKKRGLAVEFTKVAEAKEYRETLAMRSQVRTSAAQAPEALPASLFGNAGVQTA